ncbi:MAG: ABC transporter ATP-binding protein [Rhodoferax sp.]|nr:ABC transporter ATP-binding protein [Rhodoferax sp.]
MPLLHIDNLHLAMRSYEGEAHVLNGVDLQVDRGQIWGLAGETGCGKSVTGLSVSRLVNTPPARYMQGRILFDGQDVLRMDEAAMRRLRGRAISMIFQDPSTNLNPVLRVGEQIADVALEIGRHAPEILGLGAQASGAERRRAAERLGIEMLERVGIPDAARRARDYPHQFSGGMRQRVLIAMALVGQPRLLIADEPTTALDVTLQAQILRLLSELVRRSDTAVLMITHNLGVVAQICSHVAVMYAGHVVESGRTREVLQSPRHPYTRALLAALPRPGLQRGQLANLPGRVPDLIRPPPGCRFAPRCAQAGPACTVATPASVAVSDSHRVACVHADVTRGVPA